MQKKLTLRELVDGITCRFGSVQPPDDRVVSAITADSRQVVPGSMFIAVRGGSSDGHHYVGMAIDAGATAVVVEDENVVSGHGRPDVYILVVPDTRAVLGELSARFYSRPATELTMIGITGTNGKTTISYLIESGLAAAGYQVGVIGTVEYRYRTRDGRIISQPAPFTTPDPQLLHRILREMVDSGVSHVVMEVSSHALQQQRLGPVLFRLALFTNLSQDHLDYHRDMDDYFAAKCLLFSHHMVSSATAVIVTPASAARHYQAGWAERMEKHCRSLPLRVVTCGAATRAAVRLERSASTLEGSTLSYRCRGGSERRLASPLVGSFNVENVLASLTALVELGVDIDVAERTLATAHGAPGRLQRVNLAERVGGQPTVFVDYAHTPDALENVLTTLAGVEHRQLFCLVGCGGDRDRTKRPLMGSIAAALSDVTIVTDDNPRSEDPTAIRAQVIEGVRQRGRKIQDPHWLQHRRVADMGAVEIGDRAAAIEAVLSVAGAGDIVLLAGKGHEQYQITSSGKRFFDDCLTAQECSLQWDAATVAAAIDGNVVQGNNGGSRRFKSVSTDSRTVLKQDIFVALIGERFDGHDFLAKAVAAGAGCLVVSDQRRCAGLEATCVTVDDTLQALGDLAHWRRDAVRRLQHPVVVGLTGSCGKTTVKEMTAAIFEARWPDRQDCPSGRVLKTQGNFNNLVGLPHSLLPITARHRGVVLEMGMNRPGEIARLTRIADPDIVCITNIHPAHLEGLGSVDGVARAKGELFDNADRRAVLVVNCDDQRIAALAKKRQQRIVGFSVHAGVRPVGATVWAELFAADQAGHLSMTLHVDDRKAQVTIHAPGLHNGANACAAAAIAHAAGIDLACIVAGLEVFRSTVNRMESLQTRSGIRVLNDTYNANPASMASALRTLADLPAGARVALLGDMLELGDEGPMFHEGIGRIAGQLGIDYLGFVGGYAAHIRKGALDGGMIPERIVMLESRERAVDWLNELVHSAALRSGDWVLVKASRGIALDTVVKEFTDLSELNNP